MFLRELLELALASRDHAMSTHASPKGTSGVGGRVGSIQTRFVPPFPPLPALLTRNTVMKLRLYLGFIFFRVLDIAQYAVTKYGRQQPGRALSPAWASHLVPLHLYFHM